MGEDHAGKWKREKVDPHTTGMQIRVLQVRFADGATWESFKLKELSGQQGAQPGGAGVPGTGGVPPAFAPDPQTGFQPLVPGGNQQLVAPSGGNPGTLPGLTPGQVPQPTPSQ
jgi:hypothetical protein